MAEEHHLPTAETVPGTPGIREVRSGSGSECFGFCVDPVSSPPCQGKRRVSLRAEIDTSPPFGSVQEAVTWFGGRGSWVPYKNGVGEIDMKRMEEQATELEKDLIVKELETLDVLEALGSTKRIVEDLKRQLQGEALKCMVTPPDHFHSDVKEMNNEHSRNLPRDSLSSPDLILLELKQAKMNLGKTINDLSMIQSSVESMMKEKDFLEKTRTRLTSEFSGAVSLAEELNRLKTKQQVPGDGEILRTGVLNSPGELRKNFPMNLPREQDKMVAETNETGYRTSLKTAEMRLVAARKMEEAARAAEALAVAEMMVLSNSTETENIRELLFQEPPRSPLPLQAQKNDEEDFCTDISRVGILRKLEEATDEVKQSKQALEDALNQVEIASRKQIAAEDALRRWNKELWKEHKAHGTKISTKPENFCLSNHGQDSFFSHLSKPKSVDDLPKPALKPAVSMRDVLSRKQASTEDFVPERQSEGHITRRNVNLRQMLDELKEDIKYPTRADQKETNDEKQFITQRRKFGFINVSLPLQKQRKSRNP